jgi:acetyl-CoA synthetase
LGTNNPNEEAQHISYKELHERVCKMANVLTELGIKKGDRVCIYLPMIPELAVTMLACAKMGAVHSVIFAGFSASAVASRVNDCEAKMIITSDGSYRGNKAIDLKGIIDEAVEKCPTVEKVLVVKRTNTDIKIKEGRDFLLDDYYPKASTDFVTKIMDAEDPLFIFILLVLQVNQKECFTTAGYMVYTAYTFKNVFSYRENDIYWCTADIGWITGHSYILYGPF